MSSSTLPLPCLLAQASLTCILNPNRLRTWSSLYWIASFPFCQPHRWVDSHSQNTVEWKLGTANVNPAHTSVLGEGDALRLLAMRLRGAPAGRERRCRTRACRYMYVLIRSRRRTGVSLSLVARYRHETERSCV